MEPTRPIGEITWWTLESPTSSPDSYLLPLKGGESSSKPKSHILWGPSNSHPFSSMFQVPFTITKEFQSSKGSQLSGVEPCPVFGFTLHKLSFSLDFTITWKVCKRIWSPNNNQEAFSECCHKGCSFQWYPPFSPNA